MSGKPTGEVGSGGSVGNAAGGGSGGNTGGGGSGGNAAGGEKYVPGEGIRSMKTSAAFRTLNFELYAKPNKWIMAMGLAGIAMTVGYLGYMNCLSYDKAAYYEAINEDGSRTLREKKSRWES